MKNFLSLFKKPLPKVPTTLGPVSVSKMTTMVNHHEQFEENALTLITFYDAIFSNTVVPNNLMHMFKEALKISLIQKSIFCMQQGPQFDVMKQKKLFTASIKFVYGKNAMSFDKKEALALMQNAYPQMLSEKYLLESDDKASYSVIYEIFAGYSFGRQQASVHKVTFLAENQPRSIKHQEESYRFTKQPNCDLEVVYKSPEGNPFIKTYLDILIGRNKEYKGNLVVTSCNDVGAMKDQYQHYLYVLDILDQQKVSNRQKKALLAVTKDIRTIWDSDMTKPAKIISLQEKMMAFIPTAREINPNFNPNMIVFSPQRTPELSMLKKILVKDIAIILQSEGPIETNSPDIHVHKVIKATLPAYTESEKPNLALMSPTNRKLAFDFYKAYYPDYLKNFPDLI